VNQKKFLAQQNLAQFTIKERKKKIKKPQISQSDIVEHGKEFR